MILAYFLGGPEDLTKKAVPDPAPLTYCYTRPVLVTVAARPGDAPLGVVKSMYRLVYTMADGSKVYEYDPSPVEVE